MLEVVRSGIILAFDVSPGKDKQQDGRPGNRRMEGQSEDGRTAGRMDERRDKGIEEH